MATITLVPPNRGWNRGLTRPSGSRVAKPAARVAHVTPRSASAAADHGVRRTLVLERPHGGSGARPLRLTRRGRRLARTVVVALALVTLLVLSVAGRAATSQAGDGPAVPATTTVVVQPGETLWSVARGLSADTDVRETIARIQELNGLSGTAANAVRPGQQLIVPVVR